ncbi:hypothetical protein BKA93DRAFT_3671 [Sparassis latifolia]
MRPPRGSKMDRTVDNSIVSASNFSLRATIAVTKYRKYRKFQYSPTIAMDVEEGRISAEEELKRECRYRPTRPHPALYLSLRLYEYQEAWVKYVVCDRQTSRPGTPCEVADLSSSIRLKRLFDSVKGLYIGELDLSGRSTAQYEGPQGFHEGPYVYHGTCGQIYQVRRSLSRSLGKACYRRRC